MDSHKLLKVYDGTTDVRKFVTRVELEASIKGHANEKKAQYIASKLVGHAMDVYLRMAADDQKDPDKVKGELMKEFERGQLNREEAISELDRRKRASGESAETFAYKVIELVKLAYPSFADDVRMSLAKDFFVRGLSSAMQVAVKSNKEFSTMDVKALATETVRLELAGVGGTKAPAEASINSCDEMVDAIARKCYSVCLSPAGLRPERRLTSTTWTGINAVGATTVTEIVHLVGNAVVVEAKTVVELPKPKRHSVAAVLVRVPSI